MMKQQALLLMQHLLRETPAARVFWAQCGDVELPTWIGEVCLVPRGGVADVFGSVLHVGCCEGSKGYL